MMRAHVPDASHGGGAVKPKLPTDFEESTWKKLQEAIVAVQRKAPVSCSLEELYKVRGPSPVGGVRGAKAKAKAGCLFVCARTCAVHDAKSGWGGRRAQAVENMCIHKMAPNLFQRLQTQCEEHIKSEVGRLVGQTTEHEKFLQLVNACWQDHCSQMVPWCFPHVRLRRMEGGGKYRGVHGG